MLFLYFLFGVSETAFINFKDIGIHGQLKPVFFIEREIILEQTVIFSPGIFGGMSNADNFCWGKKAKATQEKFNLESNRKLELALNESVDSYLALTQSREKRDILGLLNLGVELVNFGYSSYKFSELETKINRRTKEIYNKVSTELNIVESRLCQNLEELALNQMRNLAELHIDIIKNDFRAIIYSFHNQLELTSKSHEWKLSACEKVNTFADCLKVIENHLIDSELVKLEKISKYEIELKILYQIPLIGNRDYTIQWENIGILKKEENLVNLRKLENIPRFTYNSFVLNKEQCIVKNKIDFCYFSSIEEDNECIRAILTNSTFFQSCNIIETKIHKTCISTHFRDSTIISASEPIAFFSLENSNFNLVLEPENSHLVQLNHSVIVKNCDPLTSLKAHYLVEKILDYNTKINLSLINSEIISIYDLEEIDHSSSVTSLINFEENIAQSWWERFRENAVIAVGGVSVVTLIYLFFKMSQKCKTARTAY